MTLPAAMTTKNGKPSAERWKTGWEQGGNVPIVVEQFIIERDTTPKIGGALRSQ